MKTLITIALAALAGFALSRSIDRECASSKAPQRIEVKRWPLVPSFN